MLQGLKAWVFSVMASRDDSDAPAADERGVPLDIDDVQMLMQGENHSDLW